MLGKLIRATRAAVTAPAPNGHVPVSETSQVSFCPDDGKKRILITVEEDGQFAPTRWYHMRTLNGDNGLHEASVIAAHAALILAQSVVASEVERGQQDG